jgi:hypothetical protein
MVSSLLHVVSKAFADGGDSVGFYEDVSNGDEIRCPTARRAPGFVYLRRHQTRFSRISLQKHPAARSARVQTER